MDRTNQGSAPEWAKLAGYVVLAVVVAAIGWSVAGNMEPATVSLATPSSTTSTDITEPVVTTTVVATTVNTPQPAATAAFNLSQERVSFGDDQQSVEVRLTNAGDAIGAWSVSTDHEALSAAPSAGELEPAESLTLTLTLDRARIEEGGFSATLTISWEDGTAELSAVADIVDTADPTIHNPRASPATVEVNAGGGCSPIQTTVSVRVRDESNLERVIVRWNDGSGSRETEMSPTGEDNFAATIGPFTRTGTITARVLAFDAHGNAGGANAGVEVVDCS
jgi:hypothetical protein